MTDFAARPGVALVVGANGGIGAAIARLLIDRGAEVALTYRRSVDGLPAAPAYRLDLADADACAAVVDVVAREHGALHTLIYAAGPDVAMRHLSTVPPADMDAQLAGDAGAFFRIVHPALPHLRATHGSVVAVTSAATARFPVRDGLSSAPKAAVEAIVRALAVEEGRYGVRFNCVGPGMLTDGMAERLVASGELDEQALEITRRNIPLHRFGSAADIAEAVCFLASDRAGFISGQKLDVDGGYSA